MKVMLTGASGFLGKAVINACSKLEIVALSRHEIAECQTVQADLNDSMSVTMAINSVKPDLVVHLAWEGIPDFSEAMCLRNIEQSRNLFTALQRSSCSKVLVAGSCIEYKGLQGSVHEDMWGTELDLFGKSKQAIHQLAGQMLSDRQCIWLRPFYVYGPGQRAGSLIPSLMQTVRAGVEPQIKQPQLAHDFVHLDDVAHGIARLMMSEVQSGSYNLGTGRLTFVSQVAQWLIQAWKNQPLTEYSQPEHGFFSDNTRLKAQLNWQPDIDLASAISQMVADAKRN
jgi:UDP-glucose 4-epimerase